MGIQNLLIILYFLLKAGIIALVNAMLFIALAFGAVYVLAFLCTLAYGVVFLVGWACVQTFRKAYILVAGLVSTVNTSDSKSETTGSNPVLGANN